MIINPSDKDFKETKLIKRGKRKMNSDFLSLAEWINATFNVFVIKAAQNKRYSKCGVACSMKHLKSLHTFVLADS
jgi:hypothetical protein